MSHSTVPYGDLARTGQCRGPGVVSEPRLFRRYVTDGGSSPSLPAVSAGLMYVADLDGHVHAFVVETAERIWHHEHAHPCSSGILRSPTVTSDLVVVEAGEQVFAHTRADGQVKWKVGGTCPTVVDDLGLLLVLDDPWAVRAFDAGTGHPRWQTGDRRFDGLGYGLLQSVPTIAEDVVLVAEGYEGHHTHGGLHAFDGRTGTLRWGIGEFEDPCTRPSPCDSPDQLECAPFHPVWAHDLVWNVRARMHGDYAVVEELVGLDLATGEPRWVMGEDQWLDTDAAEHMHGAPVIGARSAYCHSEDRIGALDLATKAVRWTYRLDALIVGTPALAEDTLHVATEGGVLQALDSTTGELRWRITLDEDTGWSGDFPGEYDEPETVLTLADGTLFVRTDSAVLALRC